MALVGDWPIPKKREPGASNCDVTMCRKSSDSKESCSTVQSRFGRYIFQIGRCGAYARTQLARRGKIMRLNDPRARDTTGSIDLPTCSRHRRHPARLFQRRRRPTTREKKAPPSVTLSPVLASASRSRSPRQDVRLEEM